LSDVLVSNAVVVVVDEDEDEDVVVVEVCTCAKAGTDVIGGEPSDNERATTGDAGGEFAVDTDAEVGEVARGDMGRLASMVESRDRSEISTYWITPA
jgi:hypothetical protein